MLEYFNYRALFDYSDLYLEGLLNTLGISIIALFLGGILGVILCVLRLGRNKAISHMVSFYIDAMRSTPLIVQVYFFYFGLGSFGINFNEFEVGILALSLHSGAYISEILRAGISSIPQGQIEAAMSSGFNLFQRLRYIILPQAVGVTVPPLLGQSISLVKDSSLLSLISVLELTRVGQVLTHERFLPVEGFVTTAALYLVIYYFLKHLSLWSQKRLIFKEIL